MTKINENLVNKLKEYLEVKKGLKGYGVDNSDECANIKNNIKYVENKIKKEYASDIAKMAFNSQSNNYDGGFNGTVFVDLKNNKLIAKSLTTNTVIRDDDLYKIYELHSNWIANNNWKINDILTNEEYNKLKANFNNPNYLDRKQLESINIDLDTRLIEMLEWYMTK